MPLGLYLCSDIGVTLRGKVIRMGGVSPPASVSNLCSNSINLALARSGRSHHSHGGIAD
jgi:hypothetical protein